MNPLITLLSILFLAELAGIFGAIIAVPLAAAAQIVVREIIIVRRERLAPEGLAQPPRPPGPVIERREAPRH